MGKFDNIVIFSDLDGTLLDKTILHVDQLEAINYFVSEGGLFCPATGRTEQFILDRYALPHSGLWIVRNGTTIYDAEKKALVWSKMLPDDVKYRVQELCQRFTAASVVYLHTKGGMLELQRDMPDFEERILSLDEPIYKAVMRLDDNNAAAVCEYCKAHTDYQYIQSAPYLFEILPLGSGKGVCVDVVRQMLGADKTIYGIGDYENDITLLKAVDIAVAVDGGYEPLKEFADVVAPPIEQHPVAWLIHKIEENL